jgi:hypothetical protein
MKSKIEPSHIDAVVERKEGTTWIVEFEEDPETGDLILPLNEEILAAQDWKIGDVLTWNINKETGEVSLTRDDTKQEPQA